MKGIFYILVRKWAGHMERMGDENGRVQMPRKWREKGGEEVSDCEGRTGLH